MSRAHGADTGPRWEIQRNDRGGSGWSTTASGIVGTGSETDLAAAALACCLMTVDHATDVHDYRAVVRYGLRPAHVLVSEDDLIAYLSERGYYRSASCRPPLSMVLDEASCEALPTWLHEQLDREGPPGPQ